MDDFYRHIAGLTSEAQLHFAKSELCKLYGFAPGELVTPKQGQQFFVFMSRQDVFRIPRAADAEESVAYEIELLRDNKNATTVSIPRVYETLPGLLHMRIARLPGRLFNAQTLAALPRHTQLSLADRLATFMVELHGSAPEKSIITGSMRTDAFARSDAFDRIDGLMKAESCPLILRRLVAARRCLENYGVTEGLYVRAHTDLAPSNTVYDAETDTLGVFDFGGTKYSPPYREFVEPARFHPPFFVDRMIDIYQEKSGRLVDKTLIAPFMDVLEAAYTSGLGKWDRIFAPTVPATMPHVVKCDIRAEA